MGTVTQARAERQTGRWQPALAPTARSVHLWLLAAAGLSLLALALRLVTIQRESFWLDEGYTLLFSGLPLNRLILVGGAHEHPPLYYLLVHALRGLWDSPLVPRVVSAVAGSLQVLVLYLLGARLFTRPAGLLAAGLVAIAPLHVWYSQDGRAYELAGLLVLLSYLSLVVALDRPRMAVWCAYVLCTAAALYTEYTTALVLIPQALMLLRARRSGSSRSLVLAWLGVGILFAPWLVTLLLDAQSVAGNYWIPAPTVDSVVNTILDFLNLRNPCSTPPCSGHQAALPLLTGHETLVAAAVVIGIAAVLISALARRDARLVIVTLWLMLPFAVILLLALDRSLYLDRVFLDATFAFYLLLGIGATRRRSPVQIPAVLALGLCCAAALVNYGPLYSEPTNPDWKSTIRDLQAAYRPGQVVVYNPGALQALAGASLPAHWQPTREVSLWYHAYLDVPGWDQRYARAARTFLHDSSLSLAQRYMRFDAFLRDTELSRGTVGARQVWLVTQDYSGLTDTRHWFAAHGYHLLLSELYFGDARLELWDRGIPAQLGPAVAADNDFGRAWSSSGTVRLTAGTARENGPAVMSRSFPVVPGRAYTVNIEYRAIPPAHPSVSVQLYDRAGHPVGSMLDRFERVLHTFPRTEWYDMPVDGVWLAQPFGFIAPPGATYGVLRLESQWGRCDWRHIAVYGEQPSIQR